MLDMTTTAVLRRVGLLLAVPLTAAGLGVAITLLLIPFWGWLEANLGVESIGHSGPAEWCYVVTFVALLGPIGWGAISMSRRSRY
jgi:hypothetical protein